MKLTNDIKSNIIAPSNRKFDGAFLIKEAVIQTRKT